MVSSILKSINAENVRELSHRMKLAIRAENAENNNLCISMRYKSSENKNRHPSEVTLEYIKQTCINFYQTLEYFEADNMPELAEKMEELKRIYEKHGFFCTCMQTQSDFGAFMSYSTAIMIFTKQYT